ncbi:MAG: DUF1428 domain-containing protein [Pyrinomonadaceae bacterium]|nr:DUF1428 domain-containing protein [Pyrinomonadaceae bacterium]
MAKYVDVYIIPIAEENVAGYKKLATQASRVFMKHGALSYCEYVGSDLSSEHGTIDFPKLTKAKPGETVIYSAVEFKSEAHRNKVMKAVINDPELAAMSPDKPPFDYKRMAYGGFKLLVEGK